MGVPRYGWAVLFMVCPMTSTFTQRKGLWELGGDIRGLHSHRGLLSSSPLSQAGCLPRKTSKEAAFLGLGGQGPVLPLLTPRGQNFCVLGATHPGEWVSPRGVSSCLPKLRAKA